MSTTGTPWPGVGRAASETGLPEGLGRVEAVEVLRGGSIAETRRVRCEGGTVVVKQTPYDATLEAEGLRALADVGHRVPQVHAVSTDRLVLEDVRGPPAWPELGASLAAGHQTPAAAGEPYGWSRDNVLATLRQPNEPEPHWGRFVAQRRVLAHLDAPDLPLSERTVRRCRAACDGPLPELLGPGTGPTVVHGDLWTGNVVDGRALVDPAVFRGDREYDVAYLRAFGSPPSSFWDAYLEVAPLADGWQQRTRVVHLTAHLAHARLFGSSWEQAVVSDLDTLGW